MTLAEYSLRMEAFQLAEVNRQKYVYLQAFMNQVAKSTKGGKNPKPLYRKFDDFFDIQAQIDDVRSSYESNYVRVAENKREISEIFAKRVAEFQRLKREGKIIPLKERRKEVN